MGCAKSCAKLFLTLINIVLVLSGVIMLVIGGLLKFNMSLLLKTLSALLPDGNLALLFKDERVKLLLEETTGPSIGVALMVLGGIVLGLSLLGFCAATKESKPLLIIYLIIVSVIVLAEIVAVLCFFFLKEEYINKLRDELKESEKKYDKEPAHKSFWNTVHLALQCCGVDGTFPGTTPSSCTGLGVGCADKLTKVLDTTEIPVIGTICGVIGLQVLLLIAAGVLTHKKKKDD